MLSIYRMSHVYASEFHINSLSQGDSKMKPFLLFAVVISLLANALGLQILIILPNFTMSFYIYKSTIIEALLEHGHEVMEFSRAKTSTTSKSYYHHTTGKDYEIIENTYEDMVNEGPHYKYTFGFNYMKRWNASYYECEQFFQDPIVKALLKSNVTVDLIMTPSTMGYESLLVFGHRFNAPTVSIHETTSWAGLIRDAGAPLFMDSIPDRSVLSTQDMSYFDKFINIISIMITLIGYYMYQLPDHSILLMQHYPYDAPPLEEMVNNVSLYLVNSHPAIEYPRPYPANVIPIGGITLIRNRLTLSKDVQSFMDACKDGVIFASLVSTLSDMALPTNILQDYWVAFHMVEKKVLWRSAMAKEMFSTLEYNIYHVDWVNQPAVLSHPNCVLFITQGGQSSLIDAVYAGVPIIVIPYSEEQPYNAQLIKYLGIGEIIDFKHLNAEVLQDTIEKVLRDPKYRENAKRLSEIFQDQPISPSETLAYWVDHVAAYGGSHLKPAVAYIPWYQTLIASIISFLFMDVTYILF